MSVSTECPKCGRVSYHPEDVKQRFCSFCGQFYEWMAIRDKPVRWWRKNIQVNAVGYLILSLAFWMQIGMRAHEYFTITRPLDKCLEARKEVCEVGGKTLIIRYRDDGYSLEKARSIA